MRMRNPQGRLCSSAAARTEVEPQHVLLRPLAHALRHTELAQDLRQRRSEEPKLNRVLHCGCERSIGRT